MNEIVCTLRVTAPDGPGDPVAARVSVRRLQFTVGRPIEFDNRSPHVAALEYALGAIGAEVLNGVRAAARLRRVTLDQIEALVTGEVENALVYLEVIGEHGQPRIARVQVKLFVSGPDVAAIRRLYADVVERLPLVCTLKTAVRLDLELIVTA